MRTPWNKAALVVTLVGSLASTGCKRPEDQAAKARIFSPEQPTGAQAEAQEKLDPHKLGSDPALAERVIRMPQAEIAHRLGAHKTESKVSFDWTRGPAPLLEDGGVDTSNAVTLVEEAQLAQNSDGDFSVQLKNDHNQGFELVWARGGAYARGLFGPFHKRRTDRTDPNISREQSLSVLATFDRLARGLKLHLVGNARSNGRNAIEYSIDGGGALAQEPGPKDLPPVTYPEPPAGQAGKALGADPDTARRLQLREKVQSVLLSGHLFVDAETCAPLAAELTGKFRVPASNTSAPPSELNLAVSFFTSDVGRGVTIKVPAFEPDPSTPHGVKDPLRFMGKLASAPDAEEVDEPEEEDDATAAPAGPASAHPQKTKAPQDAP